MLHGTGVYDTNEARLLEEDETLCGFGFTTGQGSGLKETDPWEMREEFLGVGQEGGGLMGMTLAYGRFGTGKDDLMVPTEWLRESSASPSRWMLLEEEFREWQRLVRAAMTRGMQEWPSLEQDFPAHKVDLLCRPLSLGVKWQDRKPTGVITCFGVLQAIVATLQIDALLGAEYRFCACVGCGKSFKVVRRDQRYCPDSECAHRQAVRDSRERERKAGRLAQEHENKTEGK